MSIDKVKLPVAANKRTKLDKSSTHLTTQSFMQLVPAYYCHMIPDEHIKGSLAGFARLAPLVVPTYGRCRVNLHAGFVPFRSVFPNWNDFIADTIGINMSNASLVSKSPILLSSNILSLFTVAANNYAIVVTSGDYDFKLSSTLYKLNADGRFAMKLLNSLGYRLIVDDKNDVEYSALPILCYAKFYADWFSNQQYSDSASFIALQKMFKFNDPASYFSMTTAQLKQVIEFCREVCYSSGNSVYYDAWDNPVAPNPGNYSTLSFEDILPSTNVTVSNATNGTPFMKQSSNTVVNIGTEYIHQVLKKFNDYVKRNQLSGARAAERYLARFGIQLDHSQLDRSIYISHSTFDVDFAAVMSSAGTSDNSLGDYAGQGLGRGKIDFDFKTDEFGMFIVFASIVPDAYLYQNVDRNNLHVAKEEFFTPELDNLGCQSIDKLEVYVSKNSNYGLATDYLNAFGYAPRYYEYKQKGSLITGDFVTASMAGGDTWHLGRELDDSSFLNIAGQQHSLGFTKGSNDWAQYSRIFQYQGAASDVEHFDNFFMVYHCSAMSLAPCRSLYDTYEFDDEGLEITMLSNGAKIN